MGCVSEFEDRRRRAGEGAVSRVLWRGRALAYERSHQVERIEICECMRLTLG